MKRCIHAAKDIISSTANDRVRQKWFSDSDMYDVPEERLQQALTIDWNDITPEDSELIVENTEDFPDISNIKSVRYFDGPEQEWAEANDWDGGYVVKLKSGFTQYFAWVMLGDNGRVHDVTNIIE